MDCGIERERERKASRVREAREIRGGWGRWRRVLTMFRVERRPGAEITDQGVSKQLRCRREVRANSMRLEVTARRSRGLRPAAGCGRGSRLTGSALSHRRPMVGVATSATGASAPLLSSDIPRGAKASIVPLGRTEIDRSSRENSRGARIRVGRFNGEGKGWWWWWAGRVCVAGQGKAYPWLSTGKGVHTVLEARIDRSQ